MNNKVEHVAYDLSGMEQTGVEMYVEDLAGEIWVDAYKLPQYVQVSNMGRVRIKPWYSKGATNLIDSQANDGVNMIPTSHKSGYPYFKKTFNGETISDTVHALVLKSFTPKEDWGKQVNHINGIKTDNRLVNLEFCTVKENANHRSKMGLSKGGLHYVYLCNEHPEWGLQTATTMAHKLFKEEGNPNLKISRIRKMIDLGQSYLRSKYTFLKYVIEDLDNEDLYVESKDIYNKYSVREDLILVEDKKIVGRYIKLADLLT